MSKTMIITLSFLIILKVSFASEYPVPAYPYDITNADIDCDGDKDLLVGSNGEGINDTISIFINNGEGIFNTFCLEQENYYNFKCAKIDEDDYPDIITALSDWYYCYYPNDGLGNFHYEPEVFHQSFTEQYEEIIINDINNDIDNDIVFYKYNEGSYWGILHNNGYGDFTEEIYFETESNIMCLDAGKINDDEYVDIVLNTGGQPPPRIFYNTGSGFTADTLMVRNWAQCNIKDMNNDGLNDILFSSIGSFVGIPTDFMISYNIGNEEFVHGDTLSMPPISIILDVADYNNDSFPDIVYHSVLFDAQNQPDEENIFISYNNQDGSFSESEMYHIGPCMFGFKVTSADFDNNGALDIAITSRDLFHVRILFNDGTGTFSDEPFVSVENEELQITNYELSNYPNPFNPSTTISFNLTTECTENTEIQIYNVKGRKIKTLNVTLSGVEGSIIWNGTDIHQNQVSSGVYLYKLVAGGRTLMSNKMIMIK